MHFFCQLEPKLAQNATINILHDFNDFPIVASLDHANCYLEHVDWYLDNACCQHRVSALVEFNKRAATRFGYLIYNPWGP